eukprot:1035415-Prymnesium_polylepis.2
MPPPTRQFKCWGGCWSVKGMLGGVRVWHPRRPPRPSPRVLRCEVAANREHLKTRGVFCRANG